MESGSKERLSWEMSIKNIQIDSVEFHMFRVGNVDILKAVSSNVYIPKTIQPIIVVGGAIVSASDLVSSSNEGEEDVCDN
jgi:hypothetical protein